MLLIPLLGCCRSVLLEEKELKEDGKKLGRYVLHHSDEPLCFVSFVCTV